MSDLVKRLASIRDIDGNRAVGVGTLREVEQLEAKWKKKNDDFQAAEAEIEQLEAELKALKALKRGVGSVLEGWSMGDGLRKSLEKYYYAPLEKDDE